MSEHKAAGGNKPGLGTCERKSKGLRPFNSETSKEKNGSGPTDAEIQHNFSICYLLNRVSQLNVHVHPPKHSCFFQPSR